MSRRRGRGRRAMPGVTHTACPPVGEVQHFIVQEFVKPLPKSATWPVPRGWQPGQPLGPGVYGRRDPRTENTLDFFETAAWFRLRYRVLLNRGRRCECCGANGKAVILHVDHIKPRSLFPHLALTESNLQVLCRPCNLGKGAWDHTDHRTPSSSAPPVLRALIAGTKRNAS